MRSKKLKKICRNCEFFLYQIHHYSHCELDYEKSFNELRDGRAIGCEYWKEKAERKTIEAKEKEA